MTISCLVEELDIESDNGRMVPGVIVTCSECDYAVQSFGTSERSVNRCLALLRESCPLGDENYYTIDDE